MSETTHAGEPGKGVPPTEGLGPHALTELALDLRWSWNHKADAMWQQLDPALWELTHNPWVVLQTVSQDRLAQALGEPSFRQRLEHLVGAERAAAAASTWFEQQHARSPLTCVAYFSLEFMLTEALPIYSGGLGNVAGDHLKAASDLGVPVVAVGLLYQRGYFRQVINHAGHQEALFPYNDPGQLPITPLRDPKGEWLRLEVRLPGYSVWLRAWQAQVGRVKLYLLDSNDAANYPAHRGVTSELYGGGPELRLRQEMVLGLGGWRLLAALGLKPQVCHLNEGHAALVVLERARYFMEESGQPFETALAVTRAGNLFTTHTAVPAGFDRFSPGLIEQYLGRYAERLGISLRDLLALGRLNPDDRFESFNMAYLAIRGSGAVNGVSRLHEQVSRRLFAPLFPRWPEAEMPVGHVTNGVHMPSWDSAAADAVWSEVCGKSRWRGRQETLEGDIRSLPDARLWQMRTENRAALIAYTHDRLALELALRGARPEAIAEARQRLDPNVLTLGFARRFATYKRPNLLLHDPERLLRLLSNPNRPVQLILAGKAHPADPDGQAMIAQWMGFIARPDACRHVVFLSDYDMLLTERLVQGVDVWLNTPRRPWEASGTSGMKALVNGVLNLSVLDGWWAEAYAPEVGWALGDGQEHGDDPAWDAIEAKALYTVLEREVVPAFYTRDRNGLPTAWLARMRESMARLTPRFSANRMVRQYTEHYYLPACAAYEQRSANHGALGARIVQWRRDLERKWSRLRFGQLDVRTAGQRYCFEVQVFLDDLAADAVQVELYADPRAGSGPTRQQMKPLRPLAGAPGGYIYAATVPANRPVTDYTPRIVPRCTAAIVPLEAPLILWLR
jgi:starch phosphorylase